MGQTLSWFRRHQDLIGVAILVIFVLLFQVGIRVALGAPNPFYVVASGSMEPTLHGGPFWVLPDIVIIEGKNRIGFDDLAAGDIIVFCQPKLRLDPCPQDYDRIIVHRVFRVDQDGVKTKGDNNAGPDSWVVHHEDFIGRVIFVVKGLGFFTFITDRGPLFPYPLNLLFGLALILVVLQRSLKEKRRREEEQGTSGKSEPEETRAPTSPSSG